MKRIMFNDKYGLTQAVLEGRKTMTRMIVKGLDENSDVSEWRLDKKSPYIIDYNDPLEKEFRPMYQVGDVVAIAQNYKDAGWNADELQQTFVRKPTLFPDLDEQCELSGWIDLPFKYHKGWNNKMLAHPGLMPHHIKISDIKVERLQDISENECLREGIGTFKSPYYFDPCYYLPIVGDKVQYYNTPREAFAALINKVLGKGTWNKNPLVFVYSFELID